MTRLPIAAQLDHAQRMLNLAASDPDLQVTLSAVGYSPPTLAHGQALYAAALAARNARHAAQGAQLGAAAEVSELRSLVERRITTLLHVVDAVFPDTVVASDLLRLWRGPRHRVSSAGTALRRRMFRRSIATILDHGHIIYRMLLEHPELLAELAVAGYPQARLAAEYADMHRMAAASTNYTAAMARTRSCVADQRAALAALQKWVARFRVIAGAALHERPDLRKKLGI